MSRRYRIRLSFCLAEALCALLLPVAAIAGICAQMEDNDSFTDDDRETSRYFDEYFVRRRGSVYFVPLLIDQIELG